MILKCVFVLLTIYSFISVVHLRKHYYGYKLFGLFPNKFQIKTLVYIFVSTPDFDIWKYSNGEDDPLQVMVSPNSTSALISYLKYFNIPYTVLIEDVGTILDMEEIEHHNRLNATKRSVAFDRYMRYEEIEQYLKEVAEKYPDLVQRSVIGKSYEGRDISVIKINAKPDPQPVILIDAGIHAREWITIPMALYIIHQLTEYQKDNTALLSGLEWNIIPLLNPDGYEYSHTENRLWRKTRSQIPFSECVGVDGNRNYGFKWNILGSGHNPCSESYAGPSAFSESEIRAIRDHVYSLDGRVRVYITFHSYGNLLLHPWSHVKGVPPNGDEVTQLGLKVSEMSVQNGGPEYKVGSSAILLYETDGVSTDWMLVEGKVPMAYGVELTDHPLGFLLPPSEILPSVQSFFKAMTPFAEYSLLN